MTFSFLHISDIHFGDESTSGWVFRNKIIDEIEKEQLKADCLVISGDLFNQGSLDESKLEDYKKFLDQLPGHEHTIVVPGNHDLYRLALQSKDGSYNVYTTRRDIVSGLGEEIRESGEFELTDHIRPILYEKAFHAFQRFSKEIGFLTFRPPDATSNMTDVECYEVQTHDLPFGNNLEYKVRFVLLNTTLIAGQSVRGKEYRDRRGKLEKAYQEALADGDSIRAATINLELAKQRKCYEDNGELIIDEETVEDRGRLSLSKGGNRKLTNIQPDGAVLTIFVGHHGFQFLAKETQKALMEAMKNCGSGIYLCGHAHQARFKRFPIQPTGSPKDIEQVQAGVLFKDEMGFAQYGFDYASFSLDENRLTGKVTSYSLVPSPSETPCWFKEDVIRYDAPLTTGAPSKEEEENIVEPDDSVKQENTDHHSTGVGRPASTSKFQLPKLQDSRTADDRKENI